MMKPMGWRLRSRLCGRWWQTRRMERVSEKRGEKWWRERRWTYEFATTNIDVGHSARDLNSGIAEVDVEVEAENKTLKEKYEGCSACSSQNWLIVPVKVVVGKETIRLFRTVTVGHQKQSLSSKSLCRVGRQPVEMCREFRSYSDGGNKKTARW